MKVHKTISVQTVLKERKRLQKLEQKAKEEARLQKLIKDTAKSILAGRGKYDLKIINADIVEMHSAYKLSSNSENSIWAAWSPLAK